MRTDYLTPWETVLLGNALTKARIEELGMLRIVEDARLIVRRVLDSVLAAAEPIGFEKGFVERQLLAANWYEIISYAKANPPTFSGSYPRGKPLPAVGTVLRGKKRRYQERTAFVYGEDEKGRRLAILVDRLEHRNAKYGHKSWSSLTETAGLPFAGKPWDLWEEVGRY